MGSVYTCQVKNNLNIKSRDTAVVETASGEHMNQKSNNAVVAFDADNKGIEYIPQGLEKIFRNLKVIYIRNGSLKEIQQSDFKHYSNLIYLELYQNDIAIIEDGVFDFIPNIRVIWLPHNKISHVGENVFSKLSKLTYLGLAENPCINESTMDLPGKGRIIIKNLKQKCFDQNFSKLSKNLKNLEMKRNI